MIAAVFAVLAAASNALASVLQRSAARSAPASAAFRLELIRHLIRQPAWLAGIAALIGGFVFQATALGFGELSLVQPILVSELPITMVLVAWVFRIRLGRESCLAVAAFTAGLTLLLVAAGPGGGDHLPDPTAWMIATIVTLGAVGCLVHLARVTSGERRAALLGVGSGLGFAFTAALMKEATRVLAENPPAVLIAWQPYAMIVAGLGSLFLLQNALQSGMLVAVQPALNVSDPVASIAYGVGLFGENIRLGAWSILEVLGTALILYGSVRLAQTPPIRRHGDVRPPAA